MEGGEKNIDSVLALLECIEKNKDLKFPIENELQTVKVELKFQRTFLRNTVNWKDDYQQMSLKFLRNTIEDVAYDHGCSLRHCVEAKDKDKVVADIKVWVSEMETLLKEYRQQIRGVYVSWSQNTWTTNLVTMRAELMVELLDSLLENLNDILNWKSNPAASLKEQLKSLEEKLRFVRYFIAASLSQCIRNVELAYVMNYVEAVANDTAFLSYMIWIDDIDESKSSMNIKVAGLLQKVKSSNPNMKEMYFTILKELISSMSYSPVMYELVKSFIGLLLHDSKELETDEYLEDVLSLAQRLVTSTLCEPEVKAKREKFDELWTLIIDIARQAGYCIYSGEITEGFTKRLARFYSEKLSNFEFPRTDELGFIDSLLENLSELLIYKSDAIPFLMQYVETILEDLKFLRSFLGDIEEPYKEHDEFKNLRTEVTRLAYAVEYQIDSLLLKNSPTFENLLCIAHLIEKIQSIKTKVTNDKNLAMTVHIAAGASYPGEWLDIKDKAQGIIDQLTTGTTLLEITSIVGRPGIGKTTLAKMVYNDPLVARHFHIRAWCSIPHVYQKRELLLEILSDVIELTDPIYKMGDSELADKLYTYLKGRRYLLVMDDVGKNGAWDGLFKSLPNDSSGSRILFTSQIHDPVLQDKHIIRVHFLNLLSEGESWELLQEKLFHKDGCPPFLVNAGKQIAQNCNGLPLALVLMAGMLSKTDKKQDWWEEVAKESSSSSNASDLQNESTFELCYKHLPDHLKPCFLYFGAFPKGKEISVKHLIWIWIAEGFVQSSGLHSLEDVGEGYLMDLIDRRLINVAERRFQGGIKTCYIHNLVHDFCAAKAEEEKFFQLVNGNEEYFLHSSDGSSSCVVSSVPIIFKLRRLVIYCTGTHFTNLRPSGPQVRSLLFFASKERYSINNDIIFIFRKFKLLCVLNLGCISVGDFFPNEVKLLVHLRYLAIQGCMNFIPSSISCLLDLETFLVKGLKGEVILPESIWDLTRLRHLHVNDHAVFTLDSYEHNDTSELHNLETFSSPSLCFGKDTERMLRRLSKLRKLRCIFFESWNSSENCNLFPELGFLSQLESVKASYSGSPRYPCRFNFPSTLKKLTLSMFRLPWREMSTIARLPNLEVLKLFSQAFEGLHWNVQDEEFLKLRFLKLDNLCFSIWNVSTNHFPCLQRLVLQRCKELKEIPSSFGYIPSLQTIEVHWCSQSAANSVKIIQEKKQVLGDELEILIRPPHWNF